MQRSGDPGLIRTADKQFRKLLLYPSELRGHFEYCRSSFRKLLGDSQFVLRTGHLSYGATLNIVAAVSGNCWAILNLSFGRAI